MSSDDAAGMEDEPHLHHKARSSLVSEISRFRATCEALRTNAIAASSGTSELQALRSQSLLQFLELRHLNRLITSYIEQHKGTVQAAKEEVDKLNLVKQSLIYEKSHFLKEINICRDFTSSERAIELLAVEEFKASDAFRAAGSPSEAYPLHLARLQHELEERKRLTVAAKEIEVKNRALKTANDKARAARKELLGRLETVYKDAASVLQLVPGCEEAVPADPHASLLPGPLFALYHLALCHKRSFDPSMDVAIEGRPDLAQQLAASEREGGDAVGASGSPAPAPAAATEHKSTEGGASDEAAGAAVHPLRVAVTDRADPTVGEVKLVFRFLSDLRVATVALESKAHLAPAWSNVLVNLYPDDNGLELPSAARPGGADALSEDAKQGHGHGRPFRWAQALCGIHTSHPRIPHFATPTFPQLIGRLRKRLRMRQSLLKQLPLLQKRTFPFPVPSAEFPTRSRTAFTKFIAITQANYNTVRDDKTDAEHTHAEWWRSGADHFSVTFKRDNLEVHAVVQVTPEYPVRPAFFHLYLNPRASRALVPNALLKSLGDPDALSLASSNEGQQATSSNSLRDMEIEVNTRFRGPLVDLAEEEAAGRYHLLSSQLRRLQVLIDNAHVL